MKKFILFTLVCAVLTATLFCFPPDSASAASTENRRQVVLDYKIAEMGGAGLNYTMRDLQDFDGNIYQLIEFSPTGYAIYHPDAYCFSEFSLSSKSPYAETAEKDIFYGAPTYYYSSVGNRLTSLIDGEKIAVEVQDVRTLGASTVEIPSTYLQFLDDQDAIADAYVKNGGSYQPINTYVADRDKEIIHGYYFRLLKDFGYNDKGTCGYLAISLLMSYYDNYVNTDFVNDAYRTIVCGTNRDYSTWSQSPGISNQLHTDLISIGSSLNIGYATNSNERKRIISKYLVSRGITGITNENADWPFGNITDTRICGLLDNNTPVILGGSFVMPGQNTNGNHAVIGYGYKTRSNVTYYTTHYGWRGGYTDVSIARIWNTNKLMSLNYIQYSGAHKHSTNYYVDYAPSGHYCGCGTIIY